MEREETDETALVTIKVEQRVQWDWLYPFHFYTSGIFHNKKNVIKK